MPNQSISRTVLLAAFASATMLYLTGPGINLWPLAFVALVPMMQLARDPRLGLHDQAADRTADQAADQAVSGNSRVRWKRFVYLAFFIYYLASLQGLRHAHPLMFVPLMAMAAYLAIYPLLFVVLLRRYAGPPWAAALAAAVLWVGGEWVRNYFATGISVLMLGHTVVDMPGRMLIQIADWQGTYGVSFLLVVVNYAIADLVLLRQGQAVAWKQSSAFAAILLIASLVYGSMSLNHPTIQSDTSIMLVGRDEQTEYLQDPQREQDVWQAYAAATMRAFSTNNIKNAEVKDAVEAGEKIDAVVWPESMFSGGQPWLIAEDDLVVPEMAGGQKLQFNEDEFRQIIEETQSQFIARTMNLQRALRFSGGDGNAFPGGGSREAPSIIGGCGIVRYGAEARQYSGIVHAGANGQVVATYEKNHLVMFGEYIPLIKSIPFLREFVPPGLGLDTGEGPSVLEVGSLKILPNLCIETAVERIAVNHLHDHPDADAIVTLTNDAWFDHSAVVSHHLRCAQMVAVATRRPILSAANGGPTAWIDSFGRIVEKLPFNEPGTITVKPMLDGRHTFYVRFGSWPTAVLGWLFVIATLRSVLLRGPKNTAPTP